MKMRGAGLEAIELPSIEWAKAHPGEPPPPEQTDVVIRLVGMEMRQRAILAVDAKGPQAEQRALPIRTFARIPLQSWDQAMDQLFGGSLGREGDGILGAAPVAGDGGKEAAGAPEAANGALAAGPGSRNGD